MPWPSALTLCVIMRRRRAGIGSISTRFQPQPDAAQLNHQLADALYAAQNYAAAATEYEHTAYDYPRNPESESAGYAALTAYQKAESGLSGSALAGLKRREIDSGVKFAQAYPDHPDSAGVLTRADETVFAAGDLPRAVQIAGILLARNPPADAAKRRIAWTIIGQADYNQRKFAAAEPAFIQARQLVAADPKMSADLTERIAASVYRQGAAKRQAGDGDGAVRDFLRVEQVAPSSTVCATALYDASAELIRLQEWSRAVQVLQDFRARFPDHPLGPTSTPSWPWLTPAPTSPCRRHSSSRRSPRSRRRPRRSGTRRCAGRRISTPRQMTFRWPMTVLTKLVAQYPTPIR